MTTPFYPIGTPGVPWGEAEVKAWRARLSRQRRYADDVLAAADYDLVVIGNRGMAGFARVLGSTANTITHRATSNLLLVNTGS